MLNIRRWLVLIVFMGLFAIISCKKETTTGEAPVIKFTTDYLYTYYNRVVPVGEQLRVGITASYNGTDKLTNFIIFSNEDRWMDIGMNQQQLSIDTIITKGFAQVEVWRFVVRDITGKSAEVSFTLTLDPEITSFGAVDTFNNVVLGAQEHSHYGSFYSLSDGSVYTLQEAYNHQGDVELLYYFDTLEDGNTLASPGANIDVDVFPGDYALVTWGIKNVTRFSRAPLIIDPVEFYKATNDSILLANTFEYSTGGRKAKNLKAGDTYAFICNGKKGLARITSVEGQKAGALGLDIIVQE